MGPVKVGRLKVVSRYFVEHLCADTRSFFRRCGSCLLLFISFLSVYSEVTDVAFTRNVNDITSFGNRAFFL